MKIAYNWLKQHLQPIPEKEVLSTLLTQMGLEVEGITSIGISKEQLTGLVVGEVVECIPHPNADKLKLTKVNIGEAAYLNIVCGAPNVAVGQKVIVAMVGTTLYPITGEPFKIKKSKIRGEESNGMICAEDEIGLGSGHDGIIILPSESKIGIPVSEVIRLDSDALIEIGITPNHADACSHLGVARELRASLLHRGTEAKMEYDLETLPKYKAENFSNPVKVNVNDSTLCPRYAGIYIRDIEVKASPEWLQNKLKSIGLKSINNIVDISNYVLHDIGQPIHIFDADKISGNNINVRLSIDGEKFTTLDAIERKLNGVELMICDAEKPMALAGVFGGLHSGVSSETKNIFIESAYFDPATIRKSAKAQGLSTDASFRFERGTDPDIVLWALYYIANLITENSGGVVSNEVIDIYPNKILPAEITLRYNFAKEIIGKSISAQEIKNILLSLNIKISVETETELKVIVPAYKKLH